MPDKLDLVLKEFEMWANARIADYSLMPLANTKKIDTLIFAKRNLKRIINEVKK